MLRTLRRGFTSIELGTALAIVAILSSVALPAYQDFAIRSQVNDGLSVVSSVQQALADDYARTGTMPNSRRAAGLPAAAQMTQSKYVAAVEIGAGGALTIVFGNAADGAVSGRTLKLTPYVQADRSLRWRCGLGPIPGGAVSGVHSPGTLSPRLMPLACRASS